MLESPIERANSEVEVLTIGSELNFFGRADRFFGPFRWALFPFLLEKAARLCRERRCRTIVATFPDELFLLLGAKVAQRLKLPFFVYLHNTLVENRTGWRLMLATYVQEKVFREAAKVLVISKGMERYYHAKYPGVTFFTLPHMFAHYPAEATNAVAVSERSPKTVVLCGNFNETNIDATRRVVRALGKSKDFRVIMYTPVPKVLLRLRGIDLDKVCSVQYVADKDFMARLVDADLLVLTLGLRGGLGEVEYRTIFPTRTIPLLLAGKPVLVHAPCNSFLAEFFREHGCGVVVDEPDEEKLLASAEALTTDEGLAQDVVTRARSVTTMFHGPKVKMSFQSAIGLNAGS